MPQLFFSDPQPLSNTYHNPPQAKQSSHVTEITLTLLENVHKVTPVDILSDFLFNEQRQQATAALRA